MMYSKFLSAGFLGLVLGGWMLTAAAQEAMPQPQDENTFISGGVGNESQEAMKAVAGNYNLRLTFAAGPEGKYLSNVQVYVEDGQGNNVLEAVSDGPLFYANLPPGSYTVHAVAMGQDQHQQVQVGQGGSDVVFRWEEPAGMEVKQ